MPFFCFLRWQTFFRNSFDSVTWEHHVLITVAVVTQKQNKSNEDKLIATVENALIWTRHDRKYRDPNEPGSHQKRLHFNFVTCNSISQSVNSHFTSIYQPNVMTSVWVWNWNCASDFVFCFVFPMLIFVLVHVSCYVRRWRPMKLKTMKQRYNHRNETGLGVFCMKMP